MYRSRYVKIFFVTVLLLFAVEVFVRIIMGSPVLTENPFTPDPVLNHTWKPNHSYLHKNHGKPFVVLTNSESWPMNSEIAVKKPKDTYRIFYIGDSNTSGAVEEKNRVTTIVQRKLSEELKKNNKKIEIINTGTPSWSASIYYLAVKNRILKYSPDLIVLNIDMTDCKDDSVYKEYTEFDENELPIAVKPSNLGDQYKLGPQGAFKLTTPQYYFQKISNYLYENLAVYYHIKDYSAETFNDLRRSDSLRKFFGKTKFIDTAQAIPEPSCWLKKNWDEEKEDIAYFRTMIENVIKLIKENDIKLVLTGVPLYPQYINRWSSKPHELLEEISKEYEVLYLNSYENLKPFISGSDVSKYYWLKDPQHLNVEGNKIWAEAQASFLLSNRNELFNEKVKE